MPRTSFQHTVATTAAKFLDYSKDRSSVRIRNTGAATVFVGGKGVSATNGHAITAGSELPLWKALGDDVENEMYSISAAGGEVLTIMESLEA